METNLISCLDNDQIENLIAAWEVFYQGKYLLPLLSRLQLCHKCLENVNIVYFSVNFHYIRITNLSNSKDKDTLVPQIIPKPTEPLFYLPCPHLNSTLHYIQHHQL